MRIDLLNLSFIDTKLRRLVQGLEGDTGLELTITSLYRPGDGGVHGTIPVRGIDARCYIRAIGIELAMMVNDKWIYDPGRPAKACCIWESNPAHLHFQVHPSTRLRMPGDPLFRGEVAIDG